MRKAIVIILSEVERPIDTYDKTGIRTKPASRLFDEGWERTFGGKREEKSREIINKKDMN